MIKVDITQEMRDKAKEMSSEMGTIKGSFMKGQGNIYGFLGELCFLEVMKDAEHKNTYEYDLVLSDGKTLDVKTKKTTVEPKPNYECSVSTWNLKQECDPSNRYTVKSECYSVAIEDLKSIN